MWWRSVVRWLAVLLMLSLFAGSALAHKLKVFARVEAGEIHGSAYFVGGAPASGVTVRVLDADGVALAQLAPDVEGRFRYRPSAPGDYLVEVDSGDGHVARWRLAATEFSPAAAVPAGQTEVAAAPQNVTGPAPASPREPVPDAALAALVEEAVARQVGPLREQLQAYEDKVRLHDVLGGLGYILGLAGLALWWRSRGRGRP
jgi:nickel transport protein